jgi:hypothetical protein
MEKLEINLVCTQKNLKYFLGANFFNFINQSNIQKRLRLKTPKTNQSLNANFSQIIVE